MARRLKEKSEKKEGDDDDGDGDGDGGDEEEDKPLKYRCSKGKGWLKEKSEVRRN